MSLSTRPRQDIEIDRERNLVRVTLSGFFTPEVAHIATMEVRMAIQSLGSAAGQHVTLYDMREVKAAPTETVELLRMGFANPVYRPLWARKVAFVTASPLLRRQIDRIREVRPDMVVYGDVDAALAWLIAP